MNLLPRCLREKSKTYVPSQIARDRKQSQRNKVEKESTEGAFPSSCISREVTGVGGDQYDVFLSFRGSDTRKGFTNHLYQSLLKAGFCVFKDDKSIPIGEEFGSQILNAVTRSKISIPIISKNYASSKWCLRELIRMMDCKKSTSHIVLPIFYKVTPSDVRHLKGKFGKAFNLSGEHFDEKDIQEGPLALNEVSYLNGWESEKFADGHEGELIERVVETVISTLQEDFQLDVPKQLIGLHGCMKKIMNWVDSPSVNARMLGIYGLGGIGKTTLAKCIYNELSKKFVHISFLPDVRENARCRGITYLQNQLVSDILQSKNKVFRIDDGINRIKSRFKGKKVLILLDDVDDKSQLDAFAREHNWFMKGSIIIVTTRNEAILDQSEFEVVYKHELNGLGKANAMLLFNRHAFRIDHSPRDFEDISRDIISTMGGLPLALQVVGSYLYKKTNRQVWEDVQKQLKNQPHRDVQKILRISYDALGDGHKLIFLDIVCYFIGYGSKFAVYMWEDCGLYPSQAIEELRLMCLIRVGDRGEFIVHDQLRDLGRSIFCQGHSLDKLSEPWDKDYKGALRVVRDHRMRDWPRAASSGDSSELLSEVRYLQWCVGERDMSLWTTNLHLPKLSVLDLTLSKMTEDWEGWNTIRALTQLRVLCLECCIGLRCTPDLSAFTKLKILDLKGSLRLEHLHPSIGKLKSLVSLDLTLCNKLKELPKELGELKELEELLLDHSSITEIPTFIGSLRKLKILSANHCESKREIPSSIEDLQKFKLLNLRLRDLVRLESPWSVQLLPTRIGAIPSEIGDLPSLEILDITDSLISDLPETICNLPSLKRLSLLGCVNLQLLPELPSGLTSLSISCQTPSLPQLSSLIHLEKLHLKACHLLEDIPKLASRLLRLRVEQCNKLTLLKLDGFKCLEELSIEECGSIERLDLSQLIHLKRLSLLVCHNLVEVQGLDKSEYLENIHIRRCNSIKSLHLSESRCLKNLEAECNFLVEIRGLDNVKISKKVILNEERRLCQLWWYMRDGELQS